MKKERLPGLRALLIAVVVTGLVLVPAALADAQGSLSYGVNAFPAGSSISALPVWHSLSGSYPAIGSISGYGSVSSLTPSSRLQYSQIVTADGKINNFAFSIHYVGGQNP